MFFFLFSGDNTEGLIKEEYTKTNLTTFIPAGNLPSSTETQAKSSDQTDNENVPDDITTFYQKIDDEDEDEDEEKDGKISTVLFLMIRHFLKTRQIKLYFVFLVKF